MTDDELKEIQERCEKASPGPWQAGNWTIGGPNMPDNGMWEWFAANGLDNPPIADAQFIAHAREDIPKLLACVKDAREHLALMHNAMSQAEYAAAIAQEEAERWKSIAENEAAINERMELFEITREEVKD